jgi:predicted metalloprotease
MPPPQPLRPGFPPAGGQPLTPSWAARPGYGAPYRPPVKKSNTGLVVAIVLSVVGLLGIGTVGVIATSNKPTRLASSDLTTYPTVSGYNPNHPTDDTTTEDITTTRGTTRTTAGRTTGRTTQSTNAGPRPVLKTGDNPMNYNLSAAAVTCNLPRFDTSPAGQDAFYRAALPCLDAAWQPVMQKAGLPFFPAKLQTITEDVSTPCGTRSATRETSLYCDGTIYMTAPYYSDNEQLGNYPGKYLGVLAHEYGHHVQNMSGILQAQATEVYDAGGADTEKGLEISRRKELQASCFSAMFMAAAQGRGSIDANIAQEAVDDESQRGDWPQYPRRDHGTPELNNAWVHQGFRTNSTQQCNTWLADAQSVA